MKARVLEDERHSPMRSRIVAACLSAGFCAVSAKGAFVAMGNVPDSPISVSNSEDAKQTVRADILDRNGERLATSISVYSLYADPSAIWDPVEITHELLTVFPDLDRETLERRLSDPSRKFVWIKREITPAERQAVFALGLEGIGFEEEAKRFYPQKSLAAHVIGFTDVDGRGLAGVEYSQNTELSTSLKPLRLTIDASVQYSLEAELASMAVTKSAKGGAGVVIDGETGEVLAMASWPTFDPNRLADSTANERLDRASGSVYELGSVFKPLTIAAALDYGLLTPRETFDVRGKIEISGKTIHDDHPVPNGKLANATSIVAHSSNIGTVEIGLRLGGEKLEQFLSSLSLMERSAIELPASARPLLPKEWSKLTQATVSFGHGLSVTPMAFAGAFASLANDGSFLSPTILLEEDPLAEVREAKRVMSAPTADLVVHMMRAAVTEGTGRYSDIPGYRVAGKTGTAEKVVDGAYVDDKNISSFAAVFPTDDPKYAVFIMLDEPVDDNGRAQSAAFTAAPAVGRVIERIAPILDVMPFFEDIEPVGLSVRQVSDRRSL